MELLYKTFPTEYVARELMCYPPRKFMPLLSEDKLVVRIFYLRPFPQSMAHCELLPTLIVIYTAIRPEGRLVVLHTVLVLLLLSEGEIVVEIIYNTFAAQFSA